ncbi:acetate--CoA ligase [Ponticoccus sp. SC2-23]|uniref:acetate--CoA ligase n=1 Tax=Alexandriicola marinus TaxID=2081710 RepID=UPI000FD6F614|nr:acetate--CoA ligase [Alexandriicola marinus]MBM1219539.1 acetate--CoA ligase [Ponticoccus sp. SC6-9]MBM1223389.1 acetate--CoA ligase [Ponticoccus sp. SC6-15]MBM1229352.1 acetate--CoA ligase [Ponticoccus sp. SC6-38]MBM1232355.1 acetate--CoA ligase [Ponticoccus sp. SC6-45]MBM1237695.1 acetate--CoA ligase [Ponticoccus sp. SC6-49]MBM1241366.1 acetate--CoA ligase [Ponticoccus sp. SC2-64]MBM1245879.1 acetate--CoA ligase [Ponticoccus sp. SC6-42]MBM1250357.1 acetate--CoA ligase [Ponticoccus sp. 
MTDAIYPPSPEIAKAAHADKAKYDEMYAASVADPDAFWGKEGKRIDWMKPYTRVKNTSFQPGEVSIKWFEDGTLNVAANCVDRHLATRAEQTAIIWEPDDPNAEARHITYAELHEQVSRFGNVLREMGVAKGDRVVLYLPMIPEAAYAMLACARIGAIHSVVFGGFSADALAARVNGCDAKVVVTADEAPRGGRNTPLKVNADRAFDKIEGETKMLVVRRTGGDIPMTEGRDFWLDELEAGVSADCPPEEMNAEDPLFILYTSGSTGQPKGVVHTSGGYLVYAAMTHQYVFDYHDGDIFWCTADVGWVTGHSYIVYGPLANGATTLMFEGVPTYPDAGRFWAVCDKHKVNQFYTAPTAIRALMGQGKEWVEGYDLSSLRILGTVGEPINPEAWDWYNEVVGKERCPIVDTWWQTETGGHLLTPLPGAIATKPGSATLPFFGVQPAILDPTSGEEIATTEAEGVLCFRDSWPAQMRTVWGDHDRFEKTYFADYKGYYFSGDGCRRDADGYYWITGRVDDVINVSGHRMGTAEVESALVAHPKVSEAAVVGYPHDVKGQGIYAYVTLMAGEEPTEELRKELEVWVRGEIGPIAKPDLIQWAPGLPKTRSGKIMRRILRKIAENDYGALGDTSTLADPSVVDDLIDNRMNRS